MHLDDSTLPAYLRRLGVFGDTERLQVEPAGDGNINFVRRVRADSGLSVIVKHARPTLERFPEYEAPTERLVFEHRFIACIAERAPEEAKRLPTVLHFDAAAPALVIEDLGDAPRLDAVLSGSQAPQPPEMPETVVGAMRQLGRLLGSFQRVTRGDAAALDHRFRNGGMRELHGEHIFSLPYERDAFPLDPDVRRHADQVLARPWLLDTIGALRTQYYERRDALVHADVQAGNVLLCGEQPVLLDAEIAHVGDPAFDLGTALTQLHFQRAVARDPGPAEAALAALCAGHREGGGDRDLEARATRYAGVEMLRRTIGAARVPIAQDPSLAVVVLDYAAQLLEA